MQFKIITKHKLPFFVALGLMTVLTSCGSFQYVGYDNDGIYSSEDYNTTDVEQPVATTSSNDSEYYKNYFEEIFPIYSVFSAIKQISIQCSASRRTGLNDSFCHRDFSAESPSPKLNSRSNARLSLQNVLTDNCPN